LLGTNLTSPNFSGKEKEKNRFYNLENQVDADILDLTCQEQRETEVIERKEPEEVQGVTETAEHAKSSVDLSS
jgi:hypothetical protein